mmetsp:Transcript_62695/g.134630  ORF Transcript_62695/g.134630 Transcript_62695/m.134630 type:complete len:214 (-) Transcript_62695:28-669(-)
MLFARPWRRCGRESGRPPWTSSILSRTSWGGAIATRRPPVAHLDLKSMNLVLDAEGQHLQICDFGLARALAADDGGPPDRPPSRGGSPRYMAPECYDSNLGPLTEKADMWSSGCVLIEIFGSSLPYAECSNVQQILNIMLVQRRGPTIPASIEARVQGAIGGTLAFTAQDRVAADMVLLQLETVARSAENKSRFQWIPLAAVSGNPERWSRSE